MKVTKSLLEQKKKEKKEKNQVPFMLNGLGLPESITIQLGRVSANCGDSTNQTLVLCPQTKSKPKSRSLLQVKGPTDIGQP